MSYNLESEKSLLEELEHKTSRLGSNLQPAQLAAIKDFCLEIIEYSKHTNLVGRAELSVLIREHVLDSLSLIPFFGGLNFASDSAALIDVGSGAGFPAVVLAIAMSELKVTLVEASGKKCRFLDQAIKKIRLEDRVSVCMARAEELGHDPAHRGAYNLGTARAVGTFDLSAELVLPFLTIGGKFFAQKSLSQKLEESERAEQCLPELGGKLEAIHSLDENVLGKPRILLVADKVRATAPIYARSWTKIRSNPLGI